MTSRPVSHGQNALVLIALLAMGAPAAWAADKAAITIEPQPLSTALQVFSEQSGLQVGFESELAKGLQTQGTRGAKTPTEALDALLSGTGLEYRFVNDQTVVIREKAQRQTANAEAGPQVMRLSQAGQSKSEMKKVENTESPQSEKSKSSGSDVSSETSDESSKGIQEIVVTAQKRMERVQDVPISISVLSGKDLDRSRVEGISEALNAVPGVATSAAYLGGDTSVVIRGVGASFPQTAGSSPVAYYLDSVPFGLVKSAVAPDANAYDMERVEVLRGPQGTLYGAGGMGGVVRILSHDAQLSGFDFKARVSGSSTQDGGDNYRGDAAVNVPIVDGKLAVRAVVGYANNDGWIDQPNRDNVNESQERSYRVKVNAQPMQNLTIGLSAWVSRDDAGAPPIGYAFDKSATVFDQPISTDYDAYGLKIGYQFSNFSVSSMTSYLGYVNEGTVGLDVAPFDGNGIFNSRMWANIFSQEVNLNSSREGNWRWSAGGIYRRGTENAYQIFTVFDIPPYRSLNTSKSYAVFGELTRVLVRDRLDLTVGLRHFHDDESQEIQTTPDDLPVPGESTAKANTPRVVLTWHPSTERMAYASYSQGFRSGFPQDPVVAGLGFPDVEPDRLRNYELGSKGNLMAGRIAYDASVYYMDWRDIQQQLTVLPPINYIAVLNGESASGVGADLAFSMEPVDDLILRAGISWNTLELDHDVISGGETLFASGDRLAASPETTASAAADYLFSIGSQGLKGRLSASANYTSSQSYRNLVGSEVVRQDGEPITIVRTSLSIDSPNKWGATLFVDNLNNEKGSPVKAFVGTENWNTRIRPRTVGLQLEYRFQ